jgi:thiamine biosynthesis protein ThiS
VARTLNYDVRFRKVSENMSSINIVLNGENKEVEQNTRLSNLLRDLNLSADKIAVEINKNVVRKKDWQSININEADKIEIIHFVGGG